MQGCLKKLIKVGSIHWVLIAGVLAGQVVS